MKKTLVLLAAFALSAAAASAQTKMAPVAPGQDAPAAVAGPGKGHRDKSPGEKADRQAARMAKEFGLNPDQENKVEQILLAERQEMAGLRDKAVANGTRKALGPEAQAIRAKYDEQLKGVLTPEQYAKLQAKRAEHREKALEHRREMGGKMTTKAKS